MKKIIILNGPNLNLLGEREKNQYGSFTLQDLDKNCKDFAEKNAIKLTFYQSNLEGELVEKIQDARKNQDGLIINLRKFNNEMQSTVYLLASSPAHQPVGSLAHWPACGRASLRAGPGVTEA